MTENYRKRCEICGKSSWKIILGNQMVSVCSGREVLKETPLVKGMCSNCGFVYTLRSPLEENIDHYYKEVYSSKLRSDAYDYRNYSHGMTFSEVQHNFLFLYKFPIIGRMIDIGCGKGFLEEAFAERYPEWEIEGVDPNVASIKMARKRMPKSRFYNKSFEGKDYEKNAYDLVCIHAVLNRVSARAFLRDITKMLKIGGILSTEIAIFPQAPFELYFADHTCMYFKEHLFAITEEFNLELVEEDTKGSKWRFLFKKVSDAGSQRKGELFAVVRGIKNRVKSIVTSWQKMLDEVNRCKNQGEKVAFYGQGSTLMIILTNIEFPKEQIAGIYDDNPHKVGEVVCGVEVKQSGDEMKRADAIVLCAGPEGIASMKNAVGDYDGKMIHL
jgi:2-polyprenyl-3-methyl-5-hydroxy-6-metoxy-1,4-benzoquinol methylase